MERILFIVPPYITYESLVNPEFNERIVKKGSKSLGSIVMDMPIGLLSLSAYIKNKTKVEVKLLDFNVILCKTKSFDYKSFKQMFKEVLSNDVWVNYEPTIIGISTLFASSFHSTLDIADEARKLYKKSLIICGGGIPANMYKEIFKTNKSIDAICFGEGEKPLLKLLQSDNKKEYLQKSSSWITRNKTKSEKYEYDFIEDLDEIPLLDYDLLDLSDYSGTSVLSLFHLSSKNSNFSTMTSRGCPHHCTFCASHTVHGRKMRYYSIERIKEDFKALKEKYSATSLTILDDHFMSNKKRVFEILNILRELGLKPSFPNSLALYALDREMLMALKSVGMDHLTLSVESGSERVLKEIMHKPLRPSIVDQVISLCRELGIATDVAILIGLPGETKNDIEEARKYFKTIRPNWFRFSAATPLVGSRMFEICEEKGYLKDDYLKCDFKKPIIETEEFTPDYIKEITYFLNLELNYVLNSDYQLGNYSTALSGFENAIKVRDDHAFAFYYAAKCCEKLNKIEKYHEYRKRFYDIYKTSGFWKEKIEAFNLPPLPTLEHDPARH
ncbi:MAG: B12-binding domain-containing radical SAM protein [Candidatus Saganbacteria bacterium]|nr:B12-binding domain-containing radical SAM protein [Candidatus Saganbacteria bacterium]